MFTGVAHVVHDDQLADPGRFGDLVERDERPAGVGVFVESQLVDELRRHVERYAGPGAECLVFRGEKGAMLR
jgi:hypothetical protein